MNRPQVMQWEQPAARLTASGRPERTSQQVFTSPGRMPANRAGIQAVILAAGRGSRLGAVISDEPKCLAKVGGRSLIDHQLKLLSDAGITRVAVTTGYRADQVANAVAGRATLFHNDAWARTEGLHSFYLCRNWITGPLLVLNCDVLLEPDALERLLDNGPNALVFDSSSGADAEEMAVEFDGEYLMAMSKNLPLNRTHGENVGVLYFDERAARLLLREAEAILKSGAAKARLPAAVQRVARYIPFRGTDVADLSWIEIDFPPIWTWLSIGFGHRFTTSTPSTISTVRRHEDDRDRWKRDDAKSK